MTKYIPGQQIRDFVRDMQPPSDFDAGFEYGFYDGDYAVIGESKVQLRPELEKIRLAALTLWQNRLITFPEILQWVKRGATDPLTDEKTMQVLTGDEQRKTVLLIKNGIFVRQW